MVKGHKAVVASLAEEPTADARPALMVLLGPAVCVLLIACANVANLLLARGLRREQALELRSRTHATLSPALAGAPQTEAAHP